MNTHDKRGIISTIVLIVIALIILGYFKISVKDIVMSQPVQENLVFAWDMLVRGVLFAMEWILARIFEFTSVSQ